MGKHFAPEPPPERKRGLDRLPHWTREPGPLALLAVGILIVACGIWTVVDMNRDSGPASLATGPADGATLAPLAPTAGPATPSGAAPTGLTSAPPATPTAAVGETPGPRPTPPPGTTARATTAAAPRSSAVTASYERTQLWDGRFEAALTLRNTSRSASTWEAAIVYPDAVTANAAFWVEGGQTPAVRREGQRWVFTSAVSIAPGATQTLKIQFDLSDQGDDGTTPVSCTVNGRACG
ncbi:cellulose binding domain-containing protein [Luedemannella helvata]|uniref:cellulose binding domain-containing protein n=1 Tax=Luedemannella helvata TaxID=349315 RepID=UPI0031E4426A